MNVGLLQIGRWKQKRERAPGWDLLLSLTHACAKTRKHARHVGAGLQTLQTGLGLIPGAPTGPVARRLAMKPATRLPLNAELPAKLVCGEEGAAGDRGRDRQRATEALMHRQGGNPALHAAWARSVSQPTTAWFAYISATCSEPSENEPHPHALACAPITYTPASPHDCAGAGAQIHTPALRL